jgi:phage shock protein A
MILTLELSPEVEAMLTEMAKQEGVSIAETLQNFLESSAEDGTGYNTTNTAVMPPEPKSPEEMDAETLATHVINEMRVRQDQSREAAVKVIAEKNNLKADAERVERTLFELEKKVLSAWKDGHSELARSLFRERMLHENVLPGLRKALLEATEAAERVKWMLRLEEERLRSRIAEKMASKVDTEQLRALATISDATTRLFSAQEAALMPEELERAFVTWVQTKQNNPEEDYRERRAWQEIIELQKRLDDLREKLTQE